jgi:hypothetical protein
MSEVDQDDLANREARMMQTIFQLAMKHGCQVRVHETTHCIWVEGPDSGQVAMAVEMADQLEWCEAKGMI